MSLRLTCCGNCADHTPGFTCTILRLQNEFPDELRVVEVECMAACSEAPAVMLDYDFYSRVTPEELYESVLAHLYTELEDELVTKLGQVQLQDS